MLYGLIALKLGDQKMVSLWGFIQFTEISGARKRRDDLFPQELLQHDKLIFNQLLAFDPQLASSLQVLKFFIQVIQPGIVLFKKQGVGLGVSEGLG